MLTITDETKIYVYTESIDMRKAINGLVVMLADIFGKNPQSGDLFVFTNKDHSKIKLLSWDCNGFVLYYKRLEKGRFHYSKYLQGEKIEVTEAQLKALLMGLDFYLLGQYPEE